MKLYIYDQDTQEATHIIEGETNEECESKADALNLDQDLFAWGYSDSGLFITTDTVSI
jgi:hypothetical protein